VCAIEIHISECAPWHANASSTPQIHKVSVIEELGAHEVRFVEHALSKIYNALNRKSPKVAPRLKVEKDKSTASVLQSS